MIKNHLRRRPQFSKGPGLSEVCFSLPSITTVVSLLLIAGSILPFIFSMSSAWAQGNVSSLRCGTDVIVLGDSNYKVLSRCGPPDAKDLIGTNYRYALPPGEFNDLEQWLYNRGPTDFVYTLRFQGGSLIDIDRGGRGF